MRRDGDTAAREAGADHTRCYTRSWHPPSRRRTDSSVIPAKAGIQDLGPPFAGTTAPRSPHYAPPAAPNASWPVALACSAIGALGVATPALFRGRSAAGGGSRWIPPRLAAPNPGEGGTDEAISPAVGLVDERKRGRKSTGNRRLLRVRSQ